MSEYWKSTPKYWCKHCSTYVKDTPFERKQHENTGKHQGNLKRFLRTIQNDHEREERDKDRAKAEVERLNKVVGGTSPSKPLSNPQASKATTSISKTGSLSAADQKRQWSQLAEMGIQVPDSARGQMAMASNWNVVSRTPVQEDAPDESLNVGIRKRKFEGDEEEEAAGETVVRKGWGSTTKRYPGTEENDIDALLQGSVSIQSRLVNTEPRLKAENELISKTPFEAEEQIKNEPADDSGVEGARTNEQKEQKSVEDFKDQEHTKEDDLRSQSSRSPDKHAAAPIPVFKKRRAKASLTKDSNGETLPETLILTRSQSS